VKERLCIPLNAVYQSGALLVATASGKGLEPIRASQQGVTFSVLVLNGKLCELVTGNSEVYSQLRGAELSESGAATVHRRCCSRVRLKCRRTTWQSGRLAAQPWSSASSLLPMRWAGKPPNGWRQMVERYRQDSSGGALPPRLSDAIGILRCQQTDLEREADAVREALCVLTVLYCDLCTRTLYANIVRYIV
jgi:hypothetical protein